MGIGETRPDRDARAFDEEGAEEGEQMIEGCVVAHIQARVRLAARVADETFVDVRIWVIFAIRL